MRIRAHLSLHALVVSSQMSVLLGNYILDEVTSSLDWEDHARKEPEASSPRQHRFQTACQRRGDDNST